MRLKVLIFVLAATAICIAGSAQSAVFTSYPVGNLGIDLVYGGGIILDKAGNIWFAAEYEKAIPTRPALCRLDTTKNRVYTFLLPTSIGVVGALTYDAPRNLIWIADSEDRKLCKFAIIGSKLTVYDLPVYQGDMPDYQSICLDGLGTVYCALYTTDAVAIFNPATPTILTGYPIANDDSEDIEPYSAAFVQYIIPGEEEEEDETSRQVVFTSGMNEFAGYLMGSVDFANRTIYSYSASAGTDMADTWCISAYTETAGTADSVYAYVTANNLDAGQLGRLIFNEDTSFGTMDLCSGLGGYGIDLSPGADFLGATEPGDAPPGAVAWADTEATWDDEDVEELSDTFDPPAEPGDPDEWIWTRKVPKPWVYKMAYKCCPIRPNVWMDDPSCEATDPNVQEDYVIDPTSQPGATVTEGDDDESGIWVADTYDDTIVLVVREEEEPI